MTFRLLFAGIIALAVVQIWFSVVEFGFLRTRKLKSFVQLKNVHLAYWYVIAASLVVGSVAIVGFVATYT
jgi:heme/copper-type cytochrome/quinol oxidase subunit 4